jgi:hypothetical protein
MVRTLAADGKADDKKELEAGRKKEGGPDIRWKDDLRKAKKLGVLFLNPSDTADTLPSQP